MKKYIKQIVVGIILVVLLVVLFLHFNKSSETQPEETTTLSAADKLVTKDLDLNYPKTPRAVVKLYSEIIESMFNDNMEDEELRNLMKQGRKLYDEELLANNPEDTQWKNMVSELNAYEQKETYLSAWEISSSSDVDYVKMNNREWAMVHATYTLKELESVSYMNVNEVYMLRKDAQGKWKIYGWQLDTQS